MIIRKLDANGDWMWGKGAGSFNFGEAAIEENLQTRLLCFLNDAFWALNFGIDWWNLIGGKNPKAEQQILLQTRTSIIQAYGVIRINSVFASEDATTRNLSVTYDIDDIYTQSVQNTVTPVAT